MKQYDSYKDSGVEWIGKIPSHWGSAPIKYTVKSPYNSFIDGDWIESKVIVSDGIRYLTTGNVGALKYKEQGSGFISESTFKELNCSEVFPGDILISRLNEPIGRACIVPDLGYRIVVAVDNVIYRPDTDLYDKQFLIYQMNCKPYADMANFIARGSTMSRVSRTTLGHFQLIVPPLIEQKIIASYLDKKCGEIDKAVATQEKRVELLKELRQNLITQAVTRGINPDAPLKDSGVEWIKEIPSHWKSVPIKYSVESPYNSFIDGDWIESNVIVSDGIRYLTTGNVGALKYKEQGSGFISESTFKELNCSEVFPGDILISRLNEPIGRACIVPDLGYRIVVAVDNVIYRPDTNLYDKQFLVYQMNCKPYADTANFIARGSTMSRVSRTTLGNFKLVIPPLDEQKKIVVYLNKKCDEIERSIEKAEHQIELLQELKQSIITEVVTGKRKVC